MEKILLAEDDDALRMMTRAILELHGFEVHAFANGQLALDAFVSVLPDIVVSDISMPIMDGYGLLQGVRQLPMGAVVPFLFLSAYSERADVAEARRLGADDYLFKPFETDDLVTAVRARIDRRRAAELFDSREAHLQTITLLANVIEARDVYTRGHVERVQQLAVELGKALGWPWDRLAVLEYGALLHDVGKITVPEAVLNKPTNLTPEELDVMRKHTTSGAHIVGGITHLESARPYILSHHEKWDGTGYPQGLKGENIPPEGRLLAIVDVFDALTSDRPYHKGVPPQEAITFLRKGSGIHFDPYMVEVFCKVQEKKLQSA